MDQAFVIEGLQHHACVTRITRALAPFAERVQVTLEPPRALLRGVHPDASLEVMQIALAGAGKYRMSPAPRADGGADTGSGSGVVATYKPLWLGLAFLVAVTLVVHRQLPGRAWPQALADFMAGVLLLSSLLKLLNFNGFVQAFRAYDLLAAQTMHYARVYPLVELALGLAWLTRWQPVPTAAATMALGLLGAAGVARALRRRQLLESTTLGTVFKLPLSKLTLIEFLVLAAQAGAMLATSERLP